MGEALSLTLVALEEMYMSRRAKGWDLRVYDYASNTWRNGEVAFSTPGTYERAVLTPPGGRPMQVRVLPPSTIGLYVDAGSAGQVAVWRALGVDLQGRHAEAVAEALEGRSGPVSLADVSEALEGLDGDAAREARKVIRNALGQGGAGP